jgi:hypothetical protein
MALFILKRRFKKPTYTMGELFYPDGSLAGHILEDRIRSDGEYIYGETAIPHGIYRVIINFSNRFQKRMLQLVNIRGGNIQFGNKSIDAAGIRIHGGNSIGDTLGCPLLGNRFDDNIGKVWECATVVDRLFTEVDRLDNTEEVYLEVINPI